MTQSEGEQSPSIKRQLWLEAAERECVRLLAAIGVIVPVQSVRISIGWPGKGGYRGKAIGECWHAEASSDAHREVFISPKLADSVTIMGTLIHELIHASLPPTAKHGPLFKAPALAVGLEGKMTATVVGDQLRDTFKQWIADNGEYPSGGLSPGAGMKKQTTRYLKCCCETCGYTVRVVNKWVQVALPQCPDPECADYHADMALEGAEEASSPIPAPVPPPEPPKAPEPSPKPPKQAKAAKPKPVKATKASAPPAAKPKERVHAPSDPKPPQGKQRIKWRGGYIDELPA